jgi:hypothetical protein
MSVVGRVVARAFWGPRPQSVEDGVAAIVATLRGLGWLDEQRFGRWFALGKSRKDALRREIAVDPDAIRSSLKRNQEGGRVFEELGWSFSAWNGASQDEQALTFRSHFSVTSQWVKNSVVFGLPPEWEQDLDRARQALDLVVRAWRPEQANVWNGDRVELLTADL